MCYLCGPLRALGAGVERDPSASKDPAVPPRCRPLNSRGYGEDLGLFQLSFMSLYQHYLTTRGELAATPNPRVLDLSDFPGYCLTSGRTPQFVWDVCSIMSVLRFAYVAIVANPVSLLKVCKNCGKVCCNTHVKSEFCGAKCRNYYNVKVFREQERAEDISGIREKD